MTEVDVARLAQLIHMVEKLGLSELIVEQHGCRYAIRGAPGRKRDHDADAPAENGAGTAAAPNVGTHAEEALERAHWLTISAPMVGVFYRSPAPGEAPYVSVGDRIEPGQTIGIIEAMKVFSEVPSDYEGVVVEIAVEDGQLVRPDEPLIYLAPLPEHSDENEHDEH
jgi:acetyl-CoA carboxylase biotin carboxyl carrier protein